MNTPRRLPLSPALAEDVVVSPLCPPRELRWPMLRQRRPVLPPIPVARKEAA